MRGWKEIACLDELKQLFGCLGILLAGSVALAEPVKVEISAAPGLALSTEPVARLTATRQQAGFEKV